MDTILLSKEQQSFLEKTQNEGYDIRLLVNPAYSMRQLRELRLGLEHGVNIKQYANPDFTPEQMQLIRWGLMQGLDVSVYAHPYLSEPSMTRAMIDLQHKRR